MKRIVSHIIPLVLLLLLPGGCAKRGRVIPAKTMSEIYAEMFLADQWLNDHSGAKRIADTSDFYGPIFEKYGYSFKDYDRSVNHYLDNPKKYTGIMEKCTKILNDRLDLLRKEEKRRNLLKEIERYLKEHALEPIDFEKDSILWMPDSLKQKIIIDSTDVKGRDSIRTDFLETPRKLIRYQPAALKREDL